VARQMGMRQDTAPLWRGFFFEAMGRTYFGMNLKAAGRYFLQPCCPNCPASAGLFLERTNRADHRRLCRIVGTCYVLGRANEANGSEREVRALAFVDSRTHRGAYSHYSLGAESGLGSARLGLSQKGGLPSSRRELSIMWVQGR
jgi:hypothetical protein